MNGIVMYLVSFCLSTLVTVFPADINCLGSITNRHLKNGKFSIPVESVFELQLWQTMFSRGTISTLTPFDASGMEERRNGSKMARM